MIVAIEHKKGYKQTKIGWIPEGWNIEMLSILTEIDKSSLSSKTDGKRIIQYVSLSDVENNKILAKEYVFSEAPSRARRITKKGDVLLATVRPNLKNFALVKSDNLIVSTGFAVLSSKKANNEFIYHYLYSEAASRQFHNLTVGTNYPALNSSDVKSFKVITPPLKEQQKIAQILSTWDDAIVKQEALIKQKLQLKRGLMQQLLTGKNRFQEFTDEWEEVRLGELGVTYSGLSGKTKEDFGQGKPYIPYMNIFSNPILDDEYLDYVDVGIDEKQNKAEYGDIFFTVSSETPDEVGMASVLLSRFDELYLNSFCFGFRLENFETLLPEFAAYYLRGGLFRREMYKAAQGATRYNLSKGNVTKVKLILPNIEEQQKIASGLSIADNEIKTLEKQLEQLKSQKHGLMQQLLTGKRRVKV